MWIVTGYFFVRYTVNVWYFDINNFAVTISFIMLFIVLVKVIIASRIVIKRHFFICSIR